jgi:hypothetical protein
VVIVAGWLVAAVLAVLVGVVGIGLVGLAGREADTMSEADVERALSEVSATPTSAEAEIGPSPSSSETASSFRTRGGTVVADCDGISSMSPADGFQVHERQSREGEFRSVRDNHDRVKVKLTCVNGIPHVDERDDD